jgi:hypothetical protein
VVRFSIPLDTGRKNIPFDFQLAFEASDHFCVVRMDWDELGNRLALFGDNDSVRIHSVEQRQALFFKFSSWDCFHERTILQEPQLFQLEKMDIIMMGFNKASECP